MWDDLTDTLPQSVAEIVAVIGLADTEKLVAAIGGTRFKFGKGIQNTARLRLLHAAIGECATEKLLAVFGGDTLYIPRCRLLLQKVRDRRFRADFAFLTEMEKQSKAMALLTLCPKYGISSRTADAILKSRDVPNVEQASLF